MLGCVASSLSNVNSVKSIPLTLMIGRFVAGFAWTIYATNPITTVGATSLFYVVKDGVDAAINAAALLAPANLGTGSAITTKFLRGDGTWQTVSAGSGDVVGPASSTDNALVSFDGLTGKLIKVCTTLPAIFATESAAVPAAGTFTAINVNGPASSTFSADFAALGSNVFLGISGTTVRLGSNTTVAWVDSTNSYAGTADTILLRLAANTLALRNGTTDQSFVIGGASSGGGVVQQTNIASTPATNTAGGKLYWKDVAGTSHLFALQSDGTEVDLTP